MYLLIRLFCLSWINYAELISIRAWWPFSRALNQRVWWNSMYIQQRFIETFKNIWRHPFQLLKILLGGNNHPRGPGWVALPYFLGGGGGVTRSDSVPAIVTVTATSALCGGFVQFKAEIIKMFRSHMIHLPPSSSVLRRAFSLPCKHDDLSPPSLSGEESEPAMATLRDFDFCWTQKIISFKSKGSLLILRPHSLMLHATYINEVTAVAYKGQGAQPRQYQITPEGGFREGLQVFSSLENKAGCPDFQFGFPLCQAGGSTLMSTVSPVMAHAKCDSPDCLLQFEVLQPFNDYQQDFSFN